jgi:hypothetical protein
LRVFSVLHDGKEKRVNGFFLDYFRYEPTVCQVIGEVVDGQLGTTPTIGDTQAESVATPAYDPAASSRNNESAINAIPAGFQMVEGMSHAEAWSQGFLAAQSQRTGFQRFF